MVLVEEAQFSGLVMVGIGREAEVRFLVNSMGAFLVDGGLNVGWLETSCDGRFAKVEVRGAHWGSGEVAQKGLLEKDSNFGINFDTEYFKLINAGLVVKG